MEAKTLKIYSTHLTSRLEYVSGVLFGTILGVDYELTNDRRKIGSSPSIIYSDENVPGSFVIRPSGLLFSTGVSQQEPEVCYLGEMPVLFPAEEGIFPFDIFSAAFYMLSRYEEYLPFAPDAHGRFQGSKSLAFRKGFLMVPVVEVWARYLANALVKKYPVLTIRHNSYRALMTIDVDQPFAYRSRGFLRSVGGLVRGIAHPGPDSSERLMTMMHKTDDPYDNFDYIEQTAEKHGSGLLFFFPTGDQGEYDRNPSYRDHTYNEIIKKYDSRHGSGLHPSYHSFGRLKVLNNEVERFRHITGHLPEKVRQHWLLMTMPDTYRAFIAAGIKYDYTMGFADEPGFRAGIARPYRHYDIGSEMTTDLTIIPFQVMDGTLRQYRNMNPVNAIETVKTLIDATKRVGGLFVSIWHNTSLSEREGWEGWREVFEATLLNQKE